jgi:micrococcal nuclease
VEVKKKVSSVKKLVVGAAAAAVVTGATAFTLPYFVGEKVIRVIDGDTFEIENSQRIRLFEVDAPELQYCGGQEAKETLTKLTLGKKVVLRDPEVDYFKRLMALVYVDGKLVNEEMLKAGMATFLGSGGPESEALKAAGEYARDNGVGILKSCVSETPPSPKCNIKGNRDPNENWAQTYYRPDCRNYIQVKVLLYQGDRWFCSENEAKEAGFEKAEVCN